MAKVKLQPFACTKCGTSYPKWVGRCLECNEWNSVQEISVRGSPASLQAPQRLQEVRESESAALYPSSIPFLDRVLSGGLPLGTVVLLAGEPGIGKSTLLFQMMVKQQDTVLYVSAEESVSQVARRFRSLKETASDKLFIFSENKVSEIIKQMEALRPRVVVIDSIQMMISDEEAFVKGGNATLRQVSELLVEKAKQLGTILWIVGHVNKEGDIAGPKTLEHLVDTVLVFSMAEDSRHRILQTQKHRFGPSGELALLEMDDRGLKEIEETDAFWTQKHATDVSGCALATVLMGSRVLNVEIQALVVTSYFPSPRRSTSGFDLNRLFLLLAVLEKRLRIPFSKLDVYLNVVGGLKLSDPGADFAVAAALVSAHSEKAIPRDQVFCGEIGLTGELRPVAAMADRLRSLGHGARRRLVSAPFELPKASKTLPPAEFFPQIEKALEGLL